MAGWTDLLTASQNKEAILNQYYAAHITALAEGEQGSSSQRALPAGHAAPQEPDILVRHYFLPPAEAERTPRRRLSGGCWGWASRSVPHADLSVPDLRHYCRDPATETVPAGSFWIPMAQPQKRWIRT